MGAQFLTHAFEYDRVGGGLMPMSSWLYPGDIWVPIHL